MSRNKKAQPTKGPYFWQREQADYFTICAGSEDDHCIIAEYFAPNCRSLNAEELATAEFLVEAANAQRALLDRKKV